MYTSMTPYPIVISFETRSFSDFTDRYQPKRTSQRDLKSVLARHNASHLRSSLILRLHDRTNLDLDHFLVEVKHPIITFKKVIDQNEDELTIQLLIPSGALIVLHQNSKKIRTNIAIVDQQMSHKHYSFYNSWFSYETGDVVTPDTYDWKSFIFGFKTVCRSGIHCFFEKQQADDYVHA